MAECGLSGPRGLLADPQRALATLVAIDAWQWTPFMALILLAGLKSLPTDILEAAEVDGATASQRFRLIVLPMLLPAAFLALVLRTMDAFRVFDIIFVTTNGGPADATNVLMIYGVKQGLEFFNIGFASAVGNVIIVCIPILSAASSPCSSRRGTGMPDRAAPEPARAPLRDLRRPGRRPRAGRLADLDRL